MNPNIVNMDPYQNDICDNVSHSSTKRESTLNSVPNLPIQGSTFLIPWDNLEGLLVPSKCPLYYLTTEFRVMHYHVKKLVVPLRLL